jgi:hypothetical protein
MSAWETFGSTYVEAATSAIPLHRLMVVVAGFIGSLIAPNLTHLSAIESILRINIASLVDLSAGPLSAASIANILVGVAFAVVAWGASRAIVKFTFYLAAHLTELEEKVKKAVETASFAGPEIAISDRQAMVSFVETTLELPRKKIRSLHSMIELAFGLGLGSLVASFWGNILDAVVGIALLFVGTFLSGLSVRHFLSDYYGHAMFRARLQGKKNPTPIDIS